MTQVEARVFLRYTKVVFFVPTDNSGAILGDCVHILRQEDSAESEGELVGPHRFYTKSHASEFCSLLNQVYHQGKDGLVAGTYYPESNRVKFCPEGKFPDEEDDSVLWRLFSKAEARKVADALNEVLKMAKEP